VVTFPRKIILTESRETEGLWCGQTAKKVIVDAAFSALGRMSWLLAATTNGWRGHKRRGNAGVILQAVERYTVFKAEKEQCHRHRTDCDRATA
jgi:hypothetical protein